MKMKSLQEIDAGNAEAAFIILSEPEKYDGLPLIWAKLWTAKHGQPEAPKEKAGTTIEERLARHDGRKRKKQVVHRRERWKRRQWRLTKKSNPTTKHKHYRIVLFERESRWNIRIIDVRTNDIEDSRRTYKTCDEAKEGAFDALIYMESKHINANPQFVIKLNEVA